MNSHPIILAILLDKFLSTAVSGTLTEDNVFSVTTNCSTDSQPCGPAPACCSSGLECNYRYGIPFSQNPNVNVIYGYDHDPCADPYMFRCDEILNISGFCCPIGTSCFTDGNDKAVSCINALGAMESALPLAITNFIPSSTPILGSNPDITYSPSNAWNTSNSNSGCATSSSLHVTNTINASVSINYTGPSIVVNTISSSNGGVFSVMVDGFDTTNTIDTYSGPGDLALPVCYPLQFPPFALPPPGYANRTNHTMTLLFTGISSLAPNGTNTSLGYFDSFAIPDLNSRFVPTSSGTSNRREITKISLLALAFSYILFM